MPDLRGWLAVAAAALTAGGCGSARHPRAAQGPAGARPGTVACLAATARAPALPSTVASRVRLPAPPGDIVALRPGGPWLTATAGALDLVAVARGKLHLVRRIPLPRDVADEPHGLALTPDGRDLLVSAGSGALVVDVGAVLGLRPAGPRPRPVLGGVHGRGGVAGLPRPGLGGLPRPGLGGLSRPGLGGLSRPGLGRIRRPILGRLPRPILGRLVSPVRAAPERAGASKVRITPDGRFAFIARTRASGVAVFDLRAAFASRLAVSGYVGRIPVGIGPAGLALSPDGATLYATALAPLAVPPGPGGVRAAPALAPAGGPSPGGVLAVVDVARAETDPGRSVRAAVAAGCEPLSVSVAADGATVWVAAFADHAVRAFAARALRRHPARARLVTVRMPGSPGGLLPLPDGRLLAADPTAAGGLVVIDAAAALRGRRALLGRYSLGHGARGVTPGGPASRSPVLVSEVAPPAVAATSLGG